MQLTSDLIEFIENVVKTAQSVNIEDVLIDAENGAVRGIDEDRTVVLFQDADVPEFPVGAIGLKRADVPEFPVGAIGLKRLSIFLNRLGIVKGREGFSLDAEIVTRDDVEYVNAFHMKSADTKVGFRCANPETIKAPKQINDDIIYRVQLNAEAVSVLQKGYGAMGTETVSVIGGDGVAFELEDMNEDVMRHVFAAESIQLGEATGSFTHKYPVSTLLALFKQNPDGEFEVGAKGILRISVNGLSIYVLPQV